MNSVSPGTGANLPVFQAAHGKSAAQIAHARNNDQIERIAGPFIAEHGVLCGHPYCVLPFFRV
jgi:hypothetical protein